MGARPKGGSAYGQRVVPKDKGQRPVHALATYESWLAELGIVNRGGDNSGREEGGNGEELHGGCLVVLTTLIKRLTA